MIPSTVQFITGMKLRELRRQRERLRDSYRRLRRDVEAAADDRERLRRLYEGLQGLQLAGQPLHPEVVNLEIALRELDAGALAADVLALWQGRLENELAAGQLRSEFVYLFGALLEEWSREGAENPVLREQSVREGQRLLGQALAPEQPNRHAEFFASLLEGLQPTLDDLSRRVEEKRSKEKTIGSLPGKDLARIASNIYQPAQVRKEADDFLTNTELQKELSDALKIFLAELDTWDWPAQGLDVRTLWTRNKWRPFLNVDLPTACLLEAVGMSWVFIWQEMLDTGESLAEHRRRRGKLQKLNVPSAILDNLRRQINQTRRKAFLELCEEIDPWADEETAPLDEEELARGSIRATRDNMLNRLRIFPIGGDYSGDADNQTLTVQFLHAEMQLARTAYPDWPLHVVKIDLQDYYASIPHDVLLTVLEKVGVPERDRRFFQRYLSPPLLVESAQPPARMRRGVPMGFTLSGALAELLLRFLDRHIQRRARLRVIRLVDDICLLTPQTEQALAGWRAVEEFCAACGLQMNRGKCGAVCLGGKPVAELPHSRPRWGMLELDEHGDWHVHTPTFQAHLAQTRQRVEAAASLFAKVQQYNANVRFLLNALALSADLGESHRRSVWEAIQTFHGSFFGPGKGIVAGLSEQVRRQFQVEAADVPEGWIYWPLTAGGLGLHNPLVTAGQYDETYRQRPRPEVPRDRPPDWDSRDNDWSAYYRKLLEPLREAEPKDTKVMKTLVDDFIQRGKTISAGKQKGLSSYWRWILYTYGPQILHQLGTFRFLIPELVPMQLIGEQRLQDSSLDGRHG
jgi:hypothetical protein